MGVSVVRTLLLDRMGWPITKGITAPRMPPHAEIIDPMGMNTGKASEKKEGWSHCLYIAELSD